MDQITFESYKNILSNIVDLTKICRFCAYQPQSLTSPQIKMKINPNMKLVPILDIGSDINSLFQQIVSINIFESTKLPQFVCIQCLKLLRSMAKYFEYLKKLKQYWDSFVDTKIEDELVFTVNEEKLEDIPIKSDSDSEDENESTEIKIESACDMEKEDTKSYLCFYCSKSFSQKWRQKSHIRHYHDRTYQRNGQFLCFYCGFGFEHKNDIQKHIIEIHRKSTTDSPISYDQQKLPLKCEACKLRYRTVNGIYKHILKKHHPHEHDIQKEPEFKCLLCPKIFTTSRKLSYHKFKHDQCSVCNKKCTSKAEHKLHIKMHAKDGGPYLCEICGMEFTLAYSAKRHVLNVHSEDTSLIHKNIGPKNLPCPLCGQGFSTFLGMKKHLEVKHSTEDHHSAYKKTLAISCMKCNKIFLNIQQLRDHCDINHVYVKTNENHIQRKRNLHKSNYQCEICKQFLNSEETLASHTARHAKKKRPFVCPKCKATYVRKSDMETHYRRAHTLDRPHECSQCIWKFATPHQLREHIRFKHNPNKPYKCDICLKQFVKASLLTIHKTKNRCKVIK